MRGRSASGKDNMGGSAASRITVAKTIDGTVLGNMGGDQNIAGHYHGMVASSTLAVSIDHDHPNTGVSGSAAAGGVDHNHAEQGGCSGGGSGSLVISRAANDDPPGTNCASINTTLGASAYSHGHGVGTYAVDVPNLSASKTPTGNIGLVTGGCDGNSSACNNLNPTVILNYIIKL
jgi:hypothetical protein